MVMPAAACVATLNDASFATTVERNPITLALLLLQRPSAGPRGSSADVIGRRRPWGSRCAVVSLQGVTDGAGDANESQFLARSGARRPH
jgi:hypothetical protein